MERPFANLLRHTGIVGALIELGRPWNGIITGLFALFGIYLAGGSVSFVNGFLIFLIFTFAYMGGAALNDIYDEEIDKINMPYRPLEEGRVNKTTAWVYSIFLHIVALLISASVGFEMLTFTILFFIFSAFYSMPPVYLSRRGLIAQIDLAVVAFFIPAYAGIVYATNTYSLNYNILLFLLSIFSLFVFIFLLKDFKDVIGDKKGGKKTPVVQYGGENVRNLILAGTIVSYIFMLYSFSLVQKLDMITLFLLSILLVALLLVENKITENPEKYFGIGRIVLLFVVLTLFSNLLI